MITQRIEWTNAQERTETASAFVAIPPALFPAMQNGIACCAMIYAIARQQAEQNTQRRTIFDRQLFSIMN